MPLPNGSSPGRLVRLAAVLLAAVLLAAACAGNDDSAEDTRDTGATSTSEPTASSTTIGEVTGNASDTSAGIEAASWGDNVTITVTDGTVLFESDGLPNHERQAEYALPNGGVVVPTADSAYAAADPTVAQDYSFAIPTTPTPAAEPTDTSLGTIGVMISGAALFNPYEGDAATVATASNFTVLNDDGEEVSFLDTCNGHPTPMGAYHYHALPLCVTATVDDDGGPSHVIGLAFDGYPIYGPYDLDGNELTADDLDGCNGITSPTPEFPEGIYHYVLLDTADSTSSIRCFTGEVDEALTTDAMGGMGGRPPGPPPGPPAP